MALTAGTRVGPFEVSGLLGAGGMGAVYRARDSRLQRDVALKVLLPEVAGDPDRLARFRREAQVLAALNHPYIAQIHGLEESDGVIALVMELVEGPTLHDAITRASAAAGSGSPGGLPLDEALTIARQLVEALEYAHDHGIVHRDLKPANIKVREDGTVKVLDFGLAKALDATAAGRLPVDATHSPTLSVHATMQGVILGTAAYMAPEQARGRAVDRRADIWAFGCVLYEMLTGRRAFDGEDTSITLAAVLKDEVKWDALPAATPPGVRRLLGRCLERDPRKRLSAIGDARFDLDEREAVAAGPVAPSALPAPRGASRMPWSIAATAAMVAAALGWAAWARPAPSIPPRVAFEFDTDTIGGFSGYHFAVSPDGRYVVARSSPRGGSGEYQLLLRAVGDVEARLLPGTEQALHPFWSPDSRRIGFFGPGNLKAIDLQGSPPETIADATVSGGGTWNSAGDIVFSPSIDQALQTVHVTGGAPRPATQLEAGQRGHRFPAFLPDGRRFLFTAYSDDPERGGIFVGSLDAPGVTRLVATQTKAQFSPPETLLFVRGQSLIAQPMDVTRLVPDGDSRVVAEGIGQTAILSGAVGFSVSAGDVLAYRRGDAGTRVLTWVDSAGRPAGTVGEAGFYENPRLSPDGSRLAVFRPESGGDIWLIDLARAVETRLTFDPASDNVPLWSPDGAAIAFVSNRGGGDFNIYRTAADGSGSNELLLSTPHIKLLNDWSADGRHLIYQERRPDTGWDLWALPLEPGPDRNWRTAPAGEPIRLLSGAHDETTGSLSPNGRWLAYTSNETGLTRVYVQAFPSAAGRWQVSAGVGSQPQWSADGRSISYDAQGQLFTVPVSGVSGGALVLGTPMPLFRGLLALSPHNRHVAPDGRFLVLTTTEASQGVVAPLTVIVNWRSP